MTDLIPQQVHEYHVFIASPGDMKQECQVIKKFFENYNRTAAKHWRVRFEVVDSGNYATAGVGETHQLITKQTLEAHRGSLAIVIGVVGQRFGSDRGESDTEKEFNWALNSYLENGFPEIKYFFRKIDEFKAPSDISLITEAVKQWEKVIAFRERLDKGTPRLYYKEFIDGEDFHEVFRKDISNWLTSSDRPWAKIRESTPEVMISGFKLSRDYYEKIVSDFRQLDISGINKDKVVKIPLSDMYVRLSVMLDEDSQTDNDINFNEGGPINIQTALKCYNRLVIVGEPGSGKSTFLRFIALMISRSILDEDSELASEKLGLEPPLPIPVFISCWELSNFIAKQKGTSVSVLNDFIKRCVKITTEELEHILRNGSCFLLFDGLDEVPTERSQISRLLEEYVKKYPENRYVVTSRVRAYTGDTILQEKFSRCDIQSFNREDQREFLLNWFALLFDIPLEKVTSNDSDNSEEFYNLLKAIENVEQIRELAVNPLLLTVIAIVHWNRKRLPEQRVELYDECIDVLLGRRKEAEHTQIGKSYDTSGEKKKKIISYNRIWSRKRFSEIAFNIALSGDKEITKQRAIKILQPRFFDRGAQNDEQADSQAEEFLKEQELRSGLLISRHSSKNYRFAHLAFKEYLAAWNIATQELAQVKKIIEPHLREPEWFEILQLLGGEWGKRSDEFLDNYIKYLLENQGDNINQQAPVIALCANIINDVSGVAEIKQDTRKIYDIALQNTLQAFQKESKIPSKTQLEILEALGKLGAVVKKHLKKAAKSRYYPVRSRAIEILVPHLSDDELFGMKDFLQDRSQETIKTYLSSLIDRDISRTRNLLKSEEYFESKAVNAIIKLFNSLVGPGNIKEGIAFARIFIERGNNLSPSDVERVLNALIIHFPENKEIRDFIRQYTHEDKKDHIQEIALNMLPEKRKAENLFDFQHIPLLLRKKIWFYFIVIVLITLISIFILYSDSGIIWDKISLWANNFLDH